MKPMTSKERWLAAVHMEPVDRLPFWPKLNSAYSRAQTGLFHNMDSNSIHDWIGSDKHIGVSSCVKEVRKNTAVETTTQNGVQKTVYRTLHGKMELIKRFDVPSQSWHPVAFPVRSLDDIRLMTDFFSDVTVELDEEAIQQTKEQVTKIGDEALTINGIGESPLMYWVEWLAGVESAHYFLMDYAQEVEALFEVIHQILLKKTEILVENSVADVFYFIENTSTTLISPDQYQKYCYRHIQEYGEITRAAGRPLILHMCGHLKALLPDLASLSVEAFEAFTSPTLGNTTLLDGRSNCPDKCLIGGTNAMLWRRSPKEIIAEIEQDLDALPHHCGIVISSAGVMPPFCQPETIKEVCEWVKNYPLTA